MNDARFFNMVRGASAYEVAVRNGFEGTEAEWIASLEDMAKHYADEAKQYAENAKVAVCEELPTPTKDYYGMFKILHTDGSDDLHICLKKNGEYTWCKIYERNTSELGMAMLNNAELGC